MRCLVAKSDRERLSTCHSIQLRQGGNVERAAPFTVLELSKATAEPLESWADHSKASLTLLAIEAENSDLGLAFIVWTENEAVALVSINHVSELCREDVIAAVFTLFLSSRRVNVLDGEVAIKILSIELALCGLTHLKVNNRSYFYIANLFVRVDA